MIFNKVWGFEDILANVNDPGCSYCAKRMYLKSGYRSSVHCHKTKDEVISVANEDGLVYFETGTEPDKLTGFFLQYPERIRLLPGTWHRFTGLRNTFLYEASTTDDPKDSFRATSSEKLVDQEFQSLISMFYAEKTTDRILLPLAATAIASALKKEGRTIGMCNGCFDLMHLGHAHLMEEAKSRCEILFVAVNTDNAIRKMKGPDRPFVNDKGRIGMVASNRWVDYVVISDSTTCLSVVEAIRPDVYITTTEAYKTSPEAKEVKKQGGKIEIVEMLPGYSTTLIAKGVKS